MSKLSVLALSGSLRKESTNTGLLKAAQELAPENLEITIYDYQNVPLYNGDLDIPQSVLELNQAIEKADAVLMAVPEYNYSIPGVLKNAIDWASRPAYQSVFRDKPTGVVSVAASFVGGARAQQHTKNILLGMGTPVFPWPEFLVGEAFKKFEKGLLQDQSTKEHLAKYLQGFAAWVAKQR